MGILLPVTKKKKSSSKYDEDFFVSYKSKGCAAESPYLEGLGRLLFLIRTWAIHARNGYIQQAEVNR